MEFYESEYSSVLIKTLTIDDLILHEIEYRFLSRMTHSSVKWILIFRTRLASLRGHSQYNP